VAIYEYCRVRRRQARVSRAFEPCEALIEYGLISVSLVEIAAEPWFDQGDSGKTSAQPREKEKAAHC
jgi:hypothetical protein